MSSPVSIAAVIVTYFPDAAFESRLGAIAREVKPLLVIDNSGDKSVESRLREACANHGAQLKANPENRGLASALNEGFAWVLKQGITSCIAFDQDSMPESGFAAALWAMASQSSKRAAIGANWHDEARPEVASCHLNQRGRTRYFFERVPAKHDLPSITCVITSGTLFDLAAWRTLGGFDPRLFLDLVDTEYCLRALTAGWTIAVAADARMHHRRGSKRAVRFLGKTWWPAFMPPSRLRYLFRNQIHLARRYGINMPHWVAFQIIYTSKILFEILALEDHKWSKLAACFRGTWDGLAGRTGRIVDITDRQASP